MFHPPFPSLQLFLSKHNLVGCGTKVRNNQKRTQPTLQVSISLCIDSSFHHGRRGVAVRELFEAWLPPHLSLGAGRLNTANLSPRSPHSSVLCSAVTSLIWPAGQSRCARASPLPSIYFPPSPPRGRDRLVMRPGSNLFPLFFLAFPSHHQTIASSRFSQSQNRLLSPVFDVPRFTLNCALLV